jgi:hypothetical protein
LAARDSLEAEQWDLGCPLNVLIGGDGWIRAGEPLLWVVDAMAGRIFVLAN